MSVSKSGTGTGLKERTKADHRIVGQSVARIDSVAKVTGASVFSTDFYLKGMLHAKILFSDRPHARIVSIDTSAALALDGVKAVITGDDVPDHRYGLYVRDKIILAKGTVTYVGDRVAAVAAVSEEIAERAVELIDVTYEDLPPLFETEAALDPDAVILHPDVAEYGAVFPYIRHGNVCMEAEIGRGDVGSAFDASDVVIERTYKTGGINQAPIEPHACVAGFDHRARLTVWTATQQLTVCQQQLAQALGVSMTDIKVVPLELGGGFGGKLKTNLEPLAAVLAQKTGQSVRLAMTREEEFIAANARAPFSIRVKLGATFDGKLTAADVDIVADAGAYSDEVVGTAMHALSSAEGSYRIPSMSVRSRAVYTNNPDYGCMRGYGTHQANFALEAHMNVMAAELGIDPAEFRLNNLLADGDRLLSTVELHDVHVRETMEAALARSGYWEKKASMGPNRGIGIANMLKGVGLMSSSANMHLNEDGTVAITTSAVEIGTGTFTILTQMAAEVLDLPMGRVSIAAPDSDAGSFDLGSIGSRTVFDMGGAVKLAAEDLKVKIAGIAATIFGCDVDEIAVSGGKAYKESDPDASIGFDGVAGASIYGFHGPLIGVGSWCAHKQFDEAPGRGFSEGIQPTHAFGTHIAEVEVDPDTGQVEVIGFTASHDVGRAINPMAIEGQIEGGISQGIGGALWEDMIVEGGRMLNPNFVDYRLPTIMDMPRVEVALVEEPDSVGPFGAKGIGEHPILGPGPAIVNAIADATDVAISEIPVTPERLVAALDAASEGAKGA